MSSITISGEGGRGIRRPSALTGFWSWFTTVDHKKIGLMYGVTAFVFFIVGGMEALLIRSQLAQPDGTLLDAAQYNEIFTMHGLTMIFLFVMPMSAAFFNYLIPLMIGARDVAFPRINAFSYWLFLFGGLFLYSSWFLGGAPNGGWFGYAPNSTTDPTSGMTFYALGLLLTGIASTAGAVNLGVTVINMRAPGMSFFRLPVFVWMGLVTQLLLVFSLPIITVGLFELLFDRRWGTHFFDPTAGGDPILWQHLFWLFGHPEVYILILPAFGIFSEVLPVFSRKPLFGYQFVVFCGIAIGFIGFGVWAHHMFAAGLGPVANTAFGISTAIIAIPTGVKIFNWMATMYRGDIRFTSAMLFSVGGVAMFVIGGLSGVTHAVVPADYQQTDTYYIVAHFHYVLFGGAIFGLFSAAYFWWPKVFGTLLSEGLGKVHFWIMIIGFNLTFGPMHILGLQGMIRREYTYPGVPGPHVLEPDRHPRVVPHRRVDPGVHRERHQDARAASPVGVQRPVGRAHAGVDDGVAAARAQLRRGPDRAFAGRVLAPEVRGGQEWQAGSAYRRGRPITATVTHLRTRSTCRARRTGRSSHRSGCRSWRTA